MASKLSELYNEVKGLREDIAEIKEMLIPEVSPSAGERRAIAAGRKAFARGQIEEWNSVRKRLTER
jgi:hypothetical protein